MTNAGSGAPLQGAVSTAPGDHMGDYTVSPESLACKDKFDIWILRRNIFTMKY